MTASSVKDGIETRLADSFEQALKLAEGLAFVDLADGTVAEAMGRDAVPTAFGEARTEFRGRPLPRSCRAKSRHPSVAHNLLASRLRSMRTEREEPERMSPAAR